MLSNLLSFLRLKGAFSRQATRDSSTSKILKKNVAKGESHDHLSSWITKLKTPDSERSREWIGLSWVTSTLKPLKHIELTHRIPYYCYKSQVISRSSFIFFHIYWIRRGFKVALHSYGVTQIFDSPPAPRFNSMGPYQRHIHVTSHLAMKKRYKEIVTRIFN
jgi:hypothetical protein